MWYYTPRNPIGVKVEARLMKKIILSVGVGFIMCLMIYPYHFIRILFYPYHFIRILFYPYHFIRILFYPYHFVRANVFVLEPYLWFCVCIYALYVCVRNCIYEHVNCMSIFMSVDIKIVCGWPICTCGWLVRGGRRVTWRAPSQVSTPAVNNYVRTVSKPFGDNCPTQSVWV